MNGIGLTSKEYPDIPGIPTWMKIQLMRLFKKTNATRLKWGYIHFFSNWSFTDALTPFKIQLLSIIGKIL